MHSKEISAKNDTLSLVLKGLSGLSLVIIIHELGHFLCAHFFNVPTPVFSLGFGPALIQIPIGSTIFQIALLPIGGYVEINQKALAAQAYIPKIMIMLAGIIFNIIFSYIIFTYYSLKKDGSSIKFADCLLFIREQTNSTRGLIGPIGLINIIGKSLTINTDMFWLILALISLNIGLFNLLPLSFFDGGKVLIFTIEALLGATITETSLSIISLFFFVIFMLLISSISINDIRTFNKKINNSPSR